MIIKEPQKLFEKKNEDIPIEGELFKIITLSGREFPLYYGYYEDCDRTNPLCDPVPIYPDFLTEPEYTDEGLPFATDMQDACEYYEGERSEDVCFGCVHYSRGEDFIGICMRRERQK
jgi:hypothetical protein